MGIQQHIRMGHEDSRSPLLIRLAGERNHIAKALATIIMREPNSVEPIAMITGIVRRGVKRKKVGDDGIPEGECLCDIRVPTGGAIDQHYPRG
jgi:hypothetical protein